MTKYYAVFDTNVIVSALLTSHPDSPTATLLNMVMDGVITPVFNEEILNEYTEVLSRKKFGFSSEQVHHVISALATGINMGRTHSDEEFPDPDDAVFYEVALSKEDAYLVTGNLKHFPRVSKVVSPTEMLEIIYLGI